MIPAAEPVRLLHTNNFTLLERGFSSDEALATLNDIRPAFRTLSPTGDTFEKCTSLLQRYGVRGKQVHDANIVAVMYRCRHDDVRPQGACHVLTTGQFSMPAGEAPAEQKSF